MIKGVLIKREASLTSAKNYTNCTKCQGALIILSFLFITMSMGCGDQSYSSSIAGEVKGNIDTIPEQDIQEYESTELDSDGDGIVNAYDSEHLSKDIYIYGNGSIEDPYEIINIYQLQAIAGVDHTGVSLSESIYTNFTWIYGDNKTSQLEKSYILRQGMNASITNTWTSVEVNATLSIAGFTPIGDCETEMICSVDGVAAFNGRFSGRGHNIDNLHISRGASDRIGLFARVGSRGVVNLVKLTNARINGFQSVGGLVGLNSGKIYASDVEGRISGHVNIGMLVGQNYGLISSSSGVGDLSGDLSIGGIAGFSSNRVEFSYTDGNIGGGRIVGGIVGLNRGEIQDSYSLGGLSGTDNLGGIAGINNPVSSIGNSYFLGEIIGTNNVGGLIGFNQGEVFLSYAEAKVSGVDAVGGLIGKSNGTIGGAYFEGNVTGDNQVGGLVGLASNNITHSYAKGKVQGESRTGGLVGEYVDRSGIHASYAVIDIVTKEQRVTGGLVGEHPSDFVSDSHWQGNEFQVLSNQPMFGIVSSQQIARCHYTPMFQINANMMCQGVFASAAWGSQITRGDIVASWYFANENEPPILIARSLNGNTSIPISYQLLPRKNMN